MDRRRLIARINEIEKKLSPRQIRFADEYMKTGDAVKAAIKLGFRESHAEKRAFNFLKCGELSEYLSLRERLLSGGAGVSRRQLAADLIEIKDRCMAAKPVMARDPETKKMVENGEWTFDVAGALRALEKLASLMDGTDEDDFEPPEERCAAASLEERERILRSIAEEFKEGES